jgi:transcriptional regulator, fur family
MNIKQQAYNRLVDHGLRPSVQRLTIMEFLLKNRTHPTVEDVYQGVVKSVPTLSRTTVYNTLRMFADMHIAQMITVDDHRVCYDGDLHPHVHFFCRECEQVYDLMDEEAPDLPHSINIAGHYVDEVQLYYKGICKNCASKRELKTLKINN